MSRRRAPQPSVPARPNGFEPGTTRAAERAPRARDAALHRASARQHALSRTRPAEYAKRRADGLDGDALSARRSWSSAEAAPPSPTSTATGISTSTLLHGRGGAGGGVSQRAAPAGLAKRRAAGGRRDPHARGRAWRADSPLGLEPDMLVMGKSISGGIPLGAYGMTTAVARRARVPTVGVLCRRGGDRRHALCQRPGDGRGSRPARRGSHPSRAYEHAAALGERLADGIEAATAAHGLRWRAHREPGRLPGRAHAGSPTLSRWLVGRSVAIRRLAHRQVALDR